MNLTTPGSLTPPACAPTRLAARGRGPVLASPGLDMELHIHAFLLQNDTGHVVLFQRDGQFSAQESHHLTPFDTSRLLVASTFQPEK